MSSDLIFFGRQRLQGRVVELGDPISYAGGEEVVEAWVGSYSYITPPTGTIPVSGEIVHSDNILGRLQFSKVDLNGKTYSGITLTTGDIVNIGGTDYTLTSPPQDFGSYISLTISPETQKQPGVYAVTTTRPAPAPTPLAAPAAKRKRTK